MAPPDRLIDRRSDRWPHVISCDGEEVAGEVERLGMARRGKLPK